MEDIHVVYRLPGMDAVRVHADITYKVANGVELHCDIYSPPAAARDLRPAIVFVHGEVPPDVVPHVKNWGQYTGWGRLVGASDCVGVTFNHRSTEGFTKVADAAADVADLLAFVRAHADQFGIDRDQLGLWTCSAGAYLGLTAALRDAPAYMRCAAAFYGLLDTQHLPLAQAQDSPLEHLRRNAAAHTRRLPLLVARAGRDQPTLNASIDTFVTSAIAAGYPLDFYNHPTGAHGFDCLNDDARTHAIITRTLAFFTEHLAPD
jgi:acetyl esterase/lipase